jgi:multidrug resistance protein MdtO
VFDQLWGAPAAVEMRRTFISILRSLAQLSKEPLSNNQRTAIERTYSLRETINSGFNKVRSLADGVLFEFGPSRTQDLVLRSRIVGWQPQLRMLFVTRIALLKYRLQLPGFELPERVRLAQREFDERLAATLDGMADRLPGEAHQGKESLEASLALLEETVRTGGSDEATGAGSTQTFLPLSRRIESLAVFLEKDILASTDRA